MAAVTIDPSIEACQALVARINAGTAYALRYRADYSETIEEDLANIGPLRVDVVPEESVQLNETLAVEDRTSHQIRIWIRAKVNCDGPETTDRLKLLARQIWQQVNNYNTANGRVKVWSEDEDSAPRPDKALLQSMNLFVASIVVRVEVEVP